MAYGMGSDLYERLKHLKRTGTGAATDPHGTPEPPGGTANARSTSAPVGPGARGAPGAGGADPMRLEPPLGWERIATGVWRRVVYRPSEDAAYLYTLLGGDGTESQARSAAGTGAIEVSGTAGTAALVPAGFGPKHLVFFDAETTGLSSGAGTSVFLVGFARIGPQGVTTEQLFMADYPAEAEFLRAVATRIGEEDLAVSYNGKGFDTHVLGTRFLLNGARPPIGAQLDLLYTTRRLWRRSLGQCSLGMVEEGVLGVRRNRDLPSGEVPERYFDFLRSGDPAGLEDAFAHHMQDIESLVLLLARIERVFADPNKEISAAATSPGGPAAQVDRFQLGRTLLQLDRPCGEHILWRIVQEDTSTSDAMRAAHLLARRYRGDGRTEAVGELWRELMSRHASVAAGIELAKYLEHRKRAFAEAENLILELLFRPHSGLYRGDLEKRLDRVRRRRARQSGVDASGAVSSGSEPSTASRYTAS
jgi:uncharacterized protein YprB with RNaseH-like and TPR domain